MFCIFAVYCRQLKLRDIEITQNVLMPAVEMLETPGAKYGIGRRIARLIKCIHPTF